METKEKTKEKLLAELDGLRMKNVLLNSTLETEIEKLEKVDALSKENEEKFREVLENSIDASYKRNLKTNYYEYLSPVFAKITGYTPEEMKTMPLEMVEELIHPDDIPEIDRILKESLSPPFGVPYKIEYRFKDKINGEYHWLCDQFTVIPDSEGNPEALIGSVSEISERKLYEKKLIESNERLQSIFNNLQDAYFEADATGKFTTVSPSALKLYRYATLEEMIGLPAVTLYANPTERENLINLLLKEGSIIDFICQGIRKDKTTFWVSMNVQVKYDKNNLFAGTVGVVRDITERKKIEDKIKQNENDLRNIYDNAIEGIYRTMLDGKNILSNKALATMLGYSSPDDVVNSVTDSGHQVWVDPDERLKFISLLEKTDIVRGYECLYKKLDGEIFWVSLNSRLVRDENGKGLYYEGFIEDITKRKNQELEIQMKMQDLKWHFDVAMHRELKMVELKNEINELAIRLGEGKRYGN